MTTQDMNLRQIIHCYGCYGLWPHNELWDLYRWSGMTFCHINHCYGCYGIWPHNRLWQPRIWTWDRLFIAMGAMDNDLIINYEIFTDDLVWLLVRLIIAMCARENELIIDNDNLPF